MLLVVSSIAVVNRRNFLKLAGGLAFPALIRTQSRPRVTHGLQIGALCRTVHLRDLTGAVLFSKSLSPSPFGIR